METSILSAYSRMNARSIFDYLERLRQSGETNMYGTVPYLQEEFPGAAIFAGTGKKKFCWRGSAHFERRRRIQNAEALPDKVQDVLSSPWAQVQRVKRSPQQTDRAFALDQTGG